MTKILEACTAEADGHNKSAGLCAQPSDTRHKPARPYSYQINSAKNPLQGQACLVRTLGIRTEASAEKAHMLADSAVDSHYLGLRHRKTLETDFGVPGEGDFAPDTNHFEVFVALVTVSRWIIKEEFST